VGGRFVGCVRAGTGIIAFVSHGVASQRAGAGVVAIVECGAGVVVAIVRCGVVLPSLGAVAIVAVVWFWRWS